MRLLKPVLILLVAGLVLAAAFVYSGVYNVAADEPHAALTGWVLAATRSRSIQVRLDDVNAPDDLDSAERIKRGGELYGENCAGCHLGPGMEATPFHEGLNPTPPRLTAHSGHHAAEEQYWIIKHGIKMSGMPAWGESWDDRSLWDVTAFALQLSDMSAGQFASYTASAKTDDQ